MIENIKQELAGELYRNFTDKFIPLAINSPQYFALLYSLIYDNDEKISWRAAWICEKISHTHPERFLEKRAEIASFAMTCRHHGKRRILLHILLVLPLEDTLSVEFLNYCFARMLQPKEPIAIQATCIKLAYKCCEKEPDLFPELQCALENATPAYYSAGVKTTIKNTLKRIQTKNKHLPYHV